VSVYAEVLPRVRDADLRAAPLAFSRDVAEELLSRGKPLLGDPLPGFDTEAAARLLSDLEAVLAGGGACGGSSPGLLEALSRYAMRPAFRRWGADAMALFPEGPRWERGACWVCGDPALLAELRGNAQARHLRCGRCGASWGFPRLACAHCGSEDRSARGVLLPERGPGTARLETCESCRGYLKTIMSHDPTPVDFLAVLDLETVPLDFLARARGYERYPCR
jgi:FdhE protein